MVTDAADAVIAAKTILISICISCFSQKQRFIRIESPHTPNLHGNIVTYLKQRVTSALLD